MNSNIYKPSILDRIFAGVTVLALVITLAPTNFALATDTETEAEDPVTESIVSEEVQMLHGNGNQNEPKVKICHATPDGYDQGKKEVSQDSILNDVAHDSHSTGGFDGRGDIIPQFGDYPGKNWDATGQAVWNNHCKPGGKIIVDKVVIGNENVTDHDFKLWVGETKVHDEQSTWFDIGTYTVSETVKEECTPTDFVTTFSGDCDAQGQITIGVGEEKTCTITNDYTPRPTTGTIIVKKTFATDTTPIAEETFSFKVGDATVVAFEEDGQNDLLEMTPGTYTITEMTHASYTPSYENCSFTLDAGETETCVITNTYVPDEEMIYGCTDRTALNYNPDANTDDQSCEYICTPGAEAVVYESFETPALAGAGVWAKIVSLTDWVITKVTDATTTTLEFHRGWSGNTAADGAQYVELDGDESTRISRTVETDIGAEYKLSWAFAARHDQPGIQNQLAVEINDAQVATNGPATDNAPLAIGDWDLSNKTFIAQGTSTKIGFLDIGTPNDSLGTYLDNVRLCRIADPVPGCMDPKADNYNEDATVDNESCTYDETSEAQCLLYSDTTTYVGETPAVLTWTHEAWTNTLTSGKWIWNAYNVSDPTNGETLTFTKEFNVATAPASSTLSVAADNRYTVLLNGTPLTCDGTGSTNYSSVDTCPAPVVAGVNTLTFEVINDPYATEDPTVNPGGLVYELHISGSVCTDVPNEEDEDTDDTPKQSSRGGTCINCGTSNGGNTNDNTDDEDGDRPEGEVEGAKDSRPKQTIPVPMVAGANTGAGGAQTPIQTLPFIALTTMIASFVIIRRTSDVR